MYSGNAGKQAHLSWLPMYAGSNPPPHAIQVGPGMYVIRGRHQRDVMPGKWNCQYQRGYVSYDGAEIEMDSCEILCDTSLVPNTNHYNWVASGNGQVPPGALFAGMTEQNEPLYVARAMVQGEMCVGKVHPSHHCAYFPYGGQEHSIPNYEVLCSFD